MVSFNGAILWHVCTRLKSLTAWLSREKLDNYQAVKEFLLKEFRISSVQLHDRFYSLRKATDETYDASLKTAQCSDVLS